MHIHILGICGTFMGGLALLAQAAGHRVTGCDANVYPPMSTQLQAAGIELVEGYESAQLALQPDLWVVGNVVSRGNALIEAVLDAGLPYVSGPEWLGRELLLDKWVLAVAGTHGKTTTSAMLVWILERAGYEPGFLIGGVPGNFGASARPAGSRYFVIEADEYDTAFFDKRSKFVHYRARTAILNNLEYDHADVFPDLAAIENQFHQFIRTLPASGRLVVNGEDAALARVLARGCWTPAEYFGVADGWNDGGGAERFEVRRGSERCGEVKWTQLGSHNRANALAAIAAANHVGIHPHNAIEALASFAGVKRRMEVRGVVRNITVYDDFAHHPTAIRATLEGLRQAVADGRILAVLEPRSNTMKLGVMKEALPESLQAADLVFCYGVSLGWDARAVLAPLGARAMVHDHLPQLIESIVRAARPGDHVVVMSNGAFGGIHEQLVARLAA